MRCPLTYKVISECTTTKARVGIISLVHSNVDTPVSLILFKKSFVVWLDFSQLQSRIQYDFELISILFI